MPIVFAGAASHIPGATGWPDAAPKEQARAFFAGFRVLQSMLERSQPDVLVIVTNEHWNHFFLNNYPGFCLGRAESYIGPVEPWLRIEKTKVPGDPQLSASLLDDLYEAGFEVSFSDELSFDHGVMVPLHFLTPEMNVPVVPILINNLTPPMPTSRRCHALGTVIGQALQKQPKRVALLAAGGLSHWPGMPQGGQINTDFDKKILSLVEQGQGEQLKDYTNAELREGGTGAYEVHNWAALAGAIPAWKGEVLAYEPVTAWVTGCAIVAFHPNGE